MIAGFGRIGKALIKRCKSFEMKVNIYDPYVDEKTIKSFGGNKINSFEEGLKTSDFLSLHIP